MLENNARGSRYIEMGCQDYRARFGGVVAEQRNLCWSDQQGHCSALIARNESDQSECDDLSDDALTLKQSINCA